MARQKYLNTWVRLKSAMSVRSPIGMHHSLLTSELGLQRSLQGGLGPMLEVVDGKFGLGRDVLNIMTRGGCNARHCRAYCGVGAVLGSPLGRASVEMWR